MLDFYPHSGFVCNRPTDTRLICNHDLVIWPHLINLMIHPLNAFVAVYNSLTNNLMKFVNNLIWQRIRHRRTHLCVLYPSHVTKSAPKIDISPVPDNESFRSHMKSCRTVTDDRRLLHALDYWKQQNHQRSLLSKLLIWKAYDLYLRTY